MAEVFNAFGISRLRMGADGDGVTTLVGGAGCLLSCRYCLNPQCARGAGKKYTVSGLFDAVSLDSLYFEATRGGVTFGGGEPLLQAGFIEEFIGFVRARGLGWRFFIETSLAADREGVERLVGLIDGWIVDCKDMNADVYRAYTGRDPATTYGNIAFLAEHAPDRLRVRVPLIPGYNTPEDCERSEAALREMGVRDVERFTYVTDIKK